MGAIEHKGTLSDGDDSGSCAVAASIQDLMQAPKFDDARCGCHENGHPSKWNQQLHQGRFQFEPDDEPFELSANACMDRNRDSFNPRMLLPIDEYNHEIFIMPRPPSDRRPAQTSDLDQTTHSEVLPPSRLPMTVLNVGEVQHPDKGPQSRRLGSLGIVRQFVDNLTQKPCSVLEIPKSRFYRPATLKAELDFIAEAQKRTGNITVRRCEVDGTHGYVVLDDFSGSSMLATRLKPPEQTVGTSPLSERAVASLAGGILHAMQELHDVRLVVGGLLPETVLISPDFGGQAQIAPWGHVRLLALPRIATSRKSLDRHIQLFMAPELHRCEQPPNQRRVAFDPAADIWALGVLVYLMLCGRFPHTSVRPTEVAQEEVLRRGQWHFLPGDIWKDISPGAKELLKDGLLQANPRLRASAKEALAHPWISTLASGKDIPLSHGFRITSRKDS